MTLHLYRRHLQSGLVAIVLAGLCSPATAQETRSKFELTPFAAFRVGGEFSGEDNSGNIDFNDSNALGLILNIKARPNAQYELFYSRQETDADTRGFLPGDPTVDVDVEHLQFGGTYLFNDSGVRPFIALTLGASRFDPNVSGAKAETFFSASFGGGLQLLAHERIGVRLEARALSTFVDSESDIFCSSGPSGGNCLIQVESNLLTQWEARAGIVFRF